MRSHPPTLITIVRRTLLEECAVGRGDRILLAVSGGGDSCALLDALGRLVARGGFELIAHGVDHGLRPEAAAELDLAERLARDWGVPFSRSRLHVAPGSNLQARARRARYAALREAAARGRAAWIATAHHADDRAETVLLRLLRGAGPRGLSVLPPRSGALIRPLVRVRRSAVLAHLTRHAIDYADDPSNRDRRYLRTRVRFELLPLLESMSPEVVGHLCALADQLSAEPTPAVVDEAGRTVELGRAQQEELRRVRRLGLLQARIRLRGGRELRFDPRTGRVVVAPAPPVEKKPSGRGGWPSRPR